LNKDEGFPELGNLTDSNIFICEALSLMALQWKKKKKNNLIVKPGKFRVPILVNFILEAQIELNLRSTKFIL
jgi:hypothetical protein